MRTTVEIDEKLLHEAIAATGTKKKRKLIELALQEVIRQRRLERLHCQVMLRFPRSLCPREGRRFMGRQALLSLHLQIFGRLLAAVRHDFIVDLLALIEGTQSRTFHRRDVHKHIFAATARWLNKAIAFCRVEPLHSSTSHVASPVLNEADIMADERTLE